MKKRLTKQEMQEYIDILLSAAEYAEDSLQEAKKKHQRCFEALWRVRNIIGPEPWLNQVLRDTKPETLREQICNFEFEEATPRQGA